MTLSIAILTSADDVADARLHRLSNALVAGGCLVEVRASGDAKNAPKGVNFYRAPGKRNFLGRIHRDLVLPLMTKADVWVVVAPDLLPPAWLLAKLRGRKIVADVREDYVQLLKDRKWAKGWVGFAARIVARLATLLAALSDLTSVADTQVPPFHAKKRLVVRNLPDLSLLTFSTELSATPTAIYIGDVRKSRGIFTILESAEKAHGWKFEIIGNIAPADVDAINSWKNNSTASARVTFHGRLAPKDSWKFAESAWVGLTLLESTPAFIEAVPSKLYEYMSSGLATISTPLPRCAALINESGAGKIVSDSKEVAELLNHWQSNPDEIRAIRAQGKKWAEENLDGQGEYSAFVAAVKGLSRPR